MGSSHDVLLQVEDAKRLVEFSKDVNAGGAVFSILKELEVERDRNFGRATVGRGRFDRNERGGSFQGKRLDTRRTGYQGGYQGGRPAPQGYRRENRWSNHENRGDNRSESRGPRKYESSGRSSGSGRYNNRSGDEW